MKNMRNFTLRGRLWADPEQVSSNVVKIPLVVTESYKDNKGEWQEKSEWFKPVCFGRNAELAMEYLRKGATVEINGSLHNRKFEKNGETQYAMDLVVDSFTPLVEMRLRRPQEEGPKTQPLESREPTPKQTTAQARRNAPADISNARKTEPPLGMEF